MDLHKMLPTMLPTHGAFGVLNPSQSKEREADVSALGHPCAWAPEGVRETRERGRRIQVRGGWLV